jgi:hypothetical protein
LYFDYSCKKRKDSEGDVLYRKTLRLVGGAYPIPMTLDSNMCRVFINRFSQEKMPNFVWSARAPETVINFRLAHFFKVPALAIVPDLGFTNAD